MSTHLLDETIVEYLDGTLATADERLADGHLAACSECRERLAGLARFDAFVQAHQPLDEVTDAALFEASERLLGRAPRRSWFGTFGVLLVAALVVFGTLPWWGGGADELALRVVRYTPPGVVRSAPPERFHLDLQLAEPAQVAVFARFADQVVELATGATGPSAAGAVRVPAHELLDWEYPADRLPGELLVVVGAALEPAAAAAIRAAWAPLGPGQLPPPAVLGGRQGHVVGFPGR